MTTKWTFGFVLPNLNVRSQWLSRPDLQGALSLQQQGIAIVPGDDPRIAEIRTQVSGADVLMGSFRSEHGEPLLPAALIVRSDVVTALNRDISAVVAFRNAVALSFILPARVRLVGDEGWPVVSWSEFFDFHPTSIATNGSLYTVTPAMTAFLIPEDGFQAMPSTALATGTDLGTFDPYLNRNLGRLWWRRFVSPRRNELRTRLVFRSLEMAFHAAAMTNRNEASLNDYGLQVALWVTALEVLARPRSGYVGQKDVLSLVREYLWDNAALTHRKYTMRFRSRKGWRYERATLIEKLCNNLYFARHRFVHGDAVTADTLTPRVGQARPAVTRVAALVYRAALSAFLERQYRVRPWSLKGQGLADNLPRLEYENALLKITD